MSLQVWLPLTKDLRQQGLSNVTVTNNGATFNSAGKLGGCYSFNGSSNYLYTTGQGYFGNNYTFSAWVYTTSTSATQTVGCIRTAVGSGFSLFLIGGKLRIDPGGNAVQWATNYTYPANTWFHLVVTYDGGTVKYYINGVLQQSYTATISSSYWGNTLSFGASQANGSNYSNYLNGRLNDVRVYDHCLSPMEVKELAKGLVLHYLLNRQGWGQENFILESHKVTGGGNASGITRTYESDGSMKIVSASSNGNWCSLSFAKDSNTNVGNNMAVGDIYCISCDVKIETGTVLPTLFINNGNGYKQLKPVYGSITTNKWMRVYYTSTWVEPGTSYGNISLHLGFSSAIGTYYFKNFKLEKGSVPTTWCPNIADTNNMGLNSTTEYDCSGFCNNGTRTGTFTWTSDTPKYQVSQVFSGSQYIVEPNEISTTDSTIALWVKGALSANAHVLDARNSSEIGKQPIYQYTNGSIQTGGNNAYVTTNTGLLVANTWVHIVLVQSGNSLLVYKNGALFQTLSCTNSPIIKPTIGARLNFSNKYTGQLSDFRVYATALSADDVKSLYQNSAYIDSSGNVYGAVH